MTAKKVTRLPADVMAGLTAARQLGAHLAARGQPTPVTAYIPLLEGEQVYSVQPFTQRP